MYQEAEDYQPEKQLHLQYQKEPKCPNTKIVKVQTTRVVPKQTYLQALLSWVQMG